MRILFCANNSPWHWPNGGLSTYLSEIVPTLLDKDHTVHILSYITHTRINSVDVSRDNLHIHYADITEYKTRNWLNRNVSGYFRRAISLPYIQLSLTRKFREVHSEFDFDIVETTAFDGIGLMPSYLSSAPCVLRLHLSPMLHPSTQDNLLDESYKFKPYLAMQNFLSRKTAQRHDHVLANSETTKSFAESQWGIENVKTLPLPMQDRDVNRYECDHDFILSCGRMTRGKGFEYIPKAMRAILTKNPDMHLYIIGGDRDVAAPFNLPSGMRDRIHTVYQLPRLKLLEYMKAAECVVLGSLWEPFGYVCLEAMMTGSIVVASSGSGFEEQIRKSGENGFLFPPENLSKLQKAVSTVLSLSSDEKRRIEDNARRRAEDFLGEDTIDEQIRYYQEVIEKSS